MSKDNSSPAARLHFNGLRFAPIASETVGDCHGFYQRTRNGFKLYTGDRRLEAFIVANDRQGRFIVSASVDSEGREFYMYSTTSPTRAWLGMLPMSGADQEAAIRAVKVTSEQAEQAPQEVIDDATRRLVTMLG